MPDLFDALSLIAAKNVAEERAAVPKATDRADASLRARGGDRGRRAALARPVWARRPRLLGWGR